MAIITRTSNTPVAYIFYSILREGIPKWVAMMFDRFSQDVLFGHTSINLYYTVQYTEYATLFWVKDYLPQVMKYKY